MPYWDHVFGESGKSKDFPDSFFVNIFTTLYIHYPLSLFFRTFARLIE